MGSLTIGRNIASLKAQRALEKSSDLLSTTSERLSSGLRINRASDDAAGLAISTSLNNQVRIYSQGIRNINDGLSALSIAEGGLSELTNIITRIKELAEQSANGTYSSTQRRAINTEAQSLRDEFNRLINVTEFNDLTLLDGSNNSLQVQAGDNAISGKELFFGISAATTANSGSFNSRVTYDGSGTSQVISDFNGDGFEDAAIASNSASGVLVSFGNGDGSFKAYASYSTGTNPLYIRGGDFNRDGVLDLITVQNATAATTVLLGNSNGTFKAAVSYAIPATAAGIAVADITRDGILDVVTTGNTTIDILAGNGDGSFKARTSISIAVSELVEAVDVNNDSILDLLVTDDSNGYAHVFLGNSNGTFKASVSYTAGGGSRAIAVGDLNNDDIVDFVVGNRTANNATVFLGNGDGTFQTTNYSTLNDPRSVGIADLNGDGIKDILSTINSQNRVSIIFGNGDGTFGTPVSYSAPNASESSVLDINRDGILDILSIGGGTNGLNVLLGNGAAKLQGFTLLTRTGALSALDLTETVLTRLTQQTGFIGAQQSRLNIALSNLAQSKTNSAAASSRITDADIAEETSTLVRAQILQQAGAAILSQANKSQDLVLNLIK